MENNPNMCDSLFVPQRCVLYASKVGQLVRDNRKLFLHKGSYHKFRGYAYAQLHKIGTASKVKPPKKIQDILAKIDKKDLVTIKEEKLRRGI